ncbi:MAG TPA: cupin domain-containing protein [Coleofasciculaceae cyanobacterium]|jgi:mannose-6-phosphate isomerase-like protein (cupin superfamily)
MAQTSLEPRIGENFAVVDLGSFSDLDQFTFNLPQLNFKVEGKLFLKQLLNLTSAEISINKLAPRQSVPFYHKHGLNEEIYIFIQGNGEFQVDGSVFPVSEGTVVRVDCDGERCWRNNSDEDLYWLVIQARAGSYQGGTSEDGIGVEKRVSWVGKERV